MSDKLLLSGDVDAIKEYVFETSFLPQLRGGSQLLIECEEEIKEYVRHTEGGKEIYCGGGSFLIEMPSEKIDQVKEDIEKIYLKNTFISTVTISSENGENRPTDSPLLGSQGIANLDRWASRISQSAIPRTTSRTSYGERSSFLNLKLREKKQRKKIAPFVETLPFADRCDCCGKRMASELVPLKKQDEVEAKEVLKVCGICYKKHQAGRSVGHETRGRFNEEFLKSIEGSIQSRQPHDLDDLVQGAKRGYLAFLYADGNDIGELLSQANTEEDYRNISEGLSCETKKSLFKALFTVCEPALRRDGHWPFEIINIGGDDVTLLIQGCYAFEVAIEFLKNFGNNVSEYINKKTPHNWSVTASCGIAIADKNYPIRFLERLAEGSLKRAKIKAKENKNAPTNAIDFLWLPNPVISDRIEPLIGYYKRWDRSLTARPYTLDEAIKLHHLAKETQSHVPSTQRHVWGEALDRGVEASMNAIFYNIARQANEKKRKSMLDILTGISNIFALSSSASPSLWSHRHFGNNSRFCTPLLDILELAELISMREEIGKEASNS